MCIRDSVAVGRLHRGAGLHDLVHVEERLVGNPDLNLRVRAEGAPGNLDVVPDVPLVLVRICDG